MVAPSFFATTSMFLAINPPQEIASLTNGTMDADSTILKRPGSKSLQGERLILLCRISGGVAPWEPSSPRPSSPTALPPTGRRGRPSGKKPRCAFPSPGRGECGGRGDRGEGSGRGAASDHGRSNKVVLRRDTNSVVQRQGRHGRGESFNGSSG